MGSLIYKSGYKLLGFDNVHKISSRRALNLPVTVKFSHVNVQVEEGKTWKISGSGMSPKEYGETSLLKQENAIGVIGGVSVLSTLIFLEKLVWMSSRDGREPVPFIVCSDPMIARAVASNSTNITPIVENLRRKRRFLEQSGVSCIVMPCHLGHIWHQEISEGCLVPFFHVGDCVVNQLKEAKLKPIEAGSGVRIGLLASSGCFYQEKLQNEGFEVMLPDKATADHILNPAREAIIRHDMEGARNLARVAIQILLMRAANVVILASDEFQNLLPHDDPLLKRCIDPMDALARSTIQWAASQHRHA